MSVANVQSAIKQGASIAGLAQQQGVSANSIVQSIESQVQKTRQANGQAPLDQSTLDRMITRAVNHPRHRGHAMSIASVAPGATTGPAAAAAGSTDPTASSSPTAGSGGSSFSTLA
jgi:predicted 2-oxoglutarate/Fe(II)-dependent dioxygenase YbiX